MRSRPFTSPSPRASTYIPNHSHGTTSVFDHEALPLANWDPETSRLLPRRQRQYRVRIQGRLAIVRTVSVVNLGHMTNGSPTTHMDMNCEEMRGHLLRRLGPYGGSDAEDENDDDEDVIAQCDAQLRGYGIGGAGNIRRPTDVTSSASPPLLSLIHISSSPPTVPLDAVKPNKSRWRMATLLRGLRDYRGKSTSADD
ncbi:hypothetical protein F5B21DRAFT_504805 [Xylaria acuta]|nr:hypothetical protein F5B21DRAFT_504805 [Xylaria acuta]